MDSITLDCFIEERIEENKELFTLEEMRWMQENKRGIRKIYLLGAINGKDCYDDI